MPKTQPHLAPERAPRDPRLDFFRGVAMFIILIAHITDNPWTLWTPARFGFSDSTEIFVFCSGMASALAFGPLFALAGWRMGTLRIGHRIWQVYCAHLGVFFLTLALMQAIDLSGLFPRNEVAALNLEPFIYNTGPNLIGLLTLTYVPNYFDILPMYIVLLALVPAMMALAKLDVRLAMLASVVLWIAGTMGINLPAELWFTSPTDRPWFFNPFAWQLLFFAGYALMAGWLPVPPVRRTLIWVAMGVVLFSVPFAWEPIIGQSGWIRDVRTEFSPLFDKTALGLLRLAHFAAVAYLAWVIVGPAGANLRKDGASAPIVAIIGRVGQQSLPVFAASMVFARGLGALLNLAEYGAWATLAVNVAGIALLVAVAEVAAYLKRQPWKVAVRRPEVAEASEPLPVGVRQ